jgi:PAS domain S-box-containing protein
VSATARPAGHTVGELRAPGGPSIAPAPSIGLREMLEASPDVIFCCDARGRLQWLSAATESLVGSRPSDLLGRPLSVLLTPPERARIGRRLVRQSRSAQGVIDEMLTITGPDARKVLVHARARRVERQGEKVFVGTVRPVFNTGSQAALAGSASQQVRELAAQLEEAQATARQKTDFLAMMSHEIRTPMNGVMGMTHLLLETKLDEKQRGLVEVIQNSARVLITLISETLDFSRLEAGKLPLENIDFDLRVTVEEVTQLLMPLAREKSLDLGCTIHHEVPSRLRGDPSRLRQVLVNFVENAVKFTEKGEVAIRVERLKEDDVGVKVRFSVKDSGIGLTPEQAKTIFDPYVQGDASTARRFGGSGLGLAISHELVELMGGVVGVQSEPLKGSTFWFDLPFDKAPAAPPLPRETSVQLRGLRVLVVDPSSSSRQSLVEMLSAWGCRSDQAEHCEDALTRMREAATGGEPYDVALIEVEQPGMDGEQLGWTVRSDDKLSKTLTMLMTAVGRRGDAARANTLGFSAYLVKPVDWSELYAALVEVVGNAKGGGGPAPQLVTRHTLAEAKRRRMRVLLVEDNPVNQLVADLALKRLGYTIDKAGDATQALEMGEQHRYDLILMDIQMPGMDGYRAASAIRARERGGVRVPIIAMTGNAAPDERQRCLAAGMDDFLAKPIDLAQLCATVEQWTRDPAEAAAGVAGATPAATRRAAAGIPASGTIGGAARQLRAGVETAKPPEQARPAVTPAHAEFAGPYATVVNDPPAAPGSRGPAGAAPAAAAAAPRALEPGTPPPAILDTARLEEASMGVPALRNSLLHTFLSDVRPRLAKLKGAVQAGDFRRVEFEAHGLKGMSRTIGAEACGLVFGQIEDMGENEALDDALPALQRAEQEVARAEEHIRRMEQSQQNAA